MGLPSGLSKHIISAGLEVKYSTLTYPQINPSLGAFYKTFYSSAIEPHSGRALSTEVS
jgi:hypothetical protein